MVKWVANLKDGIATGRTDDGSWRHLKLTINQNYNQIKDLKIISDQGESDIDSNADGYFIGNKAFIDVSHGQQITMVGIGYWKKNDSVVRIKWHNSVTMELLEVETRTPEECGFFFIKNPCQ